MISRYHGEVYGDGRHFLTVVGERGGYAPVVSIKLDTNAVSITMNMSPEQAREFSRHLKEAADLAEPRIEQTVADRRGPPYDAAYEQNHKRRY